MRKFLNKIKENDGFTLLEMAIVILIIAALLLIIIPNIGNVGETVDTTTRDALKNTVETQMVIFEVEHGNKPDLEEFRDEGYITDEQFTKYNNLNP